MIRAALWESESRVLSQKLFFFPFSREFGVRSLESGDQNQKFGVRRSKSGVWSRGFRVGGLESEVSCSQVSCSLKLGDLEEFRFTLYSVKRLSSLLSHTQTGHKKRVKKDK